MGIKYYTPQTTVGIGQGAATYPTTRKGVSGSAVAMGHLAQGFAALGKSAAQYGAQLEKRRNLEETSNAQVEFMTQLDKQTANYLSDTEFEDFETYTGQAKDQFDNLLTTTSQRITNPQIRQEFVNKMRLAKEAQYVDKIASQGRQLSESHFKASAQRDINQINSLLQNPDSMLSYEEAVTNLADKIEQYSEGQEVSEEVKEQFYKEEQLKMILSHSYGQIEKDPIAYKKALLGDYNTFLQERGYDIEGQPDEEVLKEFFESEHAPNFAREMPQHIRARLLGAADNKIAALRKKAEKAMKEQAVIDRALFDKNNELHLMSIENEGKPIQPNYIPRVMGDTSNILGEKYNLINKVANEAGIDPILFLSMLEQESGASHITKDGKIITSKVGALGIGQLMPATAKGLGVDPHDEEDNLRGAAKYLKQQLATFGGDVSKAIAAYNAGPGAVKKYKGIPPYEETQKHVKSIMAKYKKNLAEYTPELAGTSMQEQAYNITLAETGSEAQAKVAAMKQRDKEVKAELTYQIKQEIGALFTEGDLRGFLEQYKAEVAQIPANDPRKAVFSDKLKLAEAQVESKIKEMKKDPAAYIDKYANVVDGLEGATRFEARRVGQRAMGIPDGGVKVLTKAEQNFFTQNILEQDNPEARIETIRGLQQIVGPENYGLAIRQLANEEDALHSAYWMLPQLDAIGSSASNQIAKALTYFDTKELKKINTENEFVDRDLLNKLNSKLAPLLGSNMLTSDPRAAKMFRDTAYLLGRYYIATSNASDNEVADLVKKQLMDDSYHIVDSGFWTDKNILISKNQEDNLDPVPIQKLLSKYREVPFQKEDLLFLDDVIQAELEIGQDIYEEYRDMYNENFLDIVNENITYIPTVTGTGVYVGYKSPTMLDKTILLYDKNKKPIYIDFNKGQKVIQEADAYTPPTHKEVTTMVGKKSKTLTSQLDKHKMREDYFSQAIQDFR